MQTTATRTAGSHTDLLTGILNVQVRNEDKITEQDRQYCQLQQDQLYRTLDRIDRWYDIFKEEAERYREIKSFKYEDNGKVSLLLSEISDNSRESFPNCLNMAQNLRKSFLRSSSACCLVMVCAEYFSPGCRQCPQPT